MQHTQHEQEHGSDQDHCEHHGQEKHEQHQGSKSCHTGMIDDFKKRFWVSLILTIPILFLSPALRSWLGFEQGAFTGSVYVLFALSSIVFIYGGWPFLKGIVTEVKDKNPGMMTLIAVAIVVAYAYSGAVVFGLSGKLFFWELVTLIDVMLLGHWIEMKSVAGASKALEKLAALVPSDAHKIISSEETGDVPVSELQPGDRVLVKPGEKIPVDGVVLKGKSVVNEALHTGESKPVIKKKGDEVIGGSVNGEGALTVQVEKIGEESFISQVTEMVRQAQASKSRTQTLANTAAKWLTLIAISVGILTFALWLVFSGQDFSFALERAVTVMVITCPHALGLAIPLVVSVSTSISARNGLLIRNRSAFEKARNVQAILLDKTGTLTKGEFGVTDVVERRKYKVKRGAIVDLAAAVEAHSEHPIAKGIVAAATAKKHVEDFQSISGKGVQGIVDGKEVMVVSPAYIQEEHTVTDIDVESLEKEGKTAVFVIVDSAVVGAIALGDSLREESKDAVAMLRGMGIKTIMITGDSEAVARAVAEQVGVDEYVAEVLPGEKEKKVQEVQARGLAVAMVGDGVNDAPALARADVGIAIGAGTDVAVETADVILVKSNPKDIVSVLYLARATYRKMIQNLIWATGYNALMSPLAAGALVSFGIIVSPALGALLMSISTVVVAVNARFLKI